MSNAFLDVSNYMQQYLNTLSFKFPHLDLSYYLASGLLSEKNAETDSRLKQEWDNHCESPSTFFFRGHGCTGLLKGWQCGVIKAVREGWGCCFCFRLERTNRYSAENFCSLTTHTERENDKPREWEGKGWRDSRLFTALPVAVFHLFPLKVT